jgi:hypothetical protein
MDILSIFVIQTLPIMRDALKEMQKKARSIGVNVGVSTITVSHQDVGDYKLTLSLTNNTEVRVNVPEKDDLNYAGIASAKSAQMQRTGKFSGNDDGFIGEVSYRGGVCFKKEGYSLQVSYSGGTEDEDLEIAEVGIVAMGVCW